MIGKTISSRYKIYDKVGSGGMAEVFLARDLSSGEIVALKVLREQFTEGEDYIERFEREAKSATKLNHPNICLAKDYGQEDDTYYMVMEYIEGKTLTSVIEEKGALPIQEAASYVIQIAKALEHAYSKGLVAHRDIKSQNIMVTASGQVKIMDFGIAKSKDFATMTSAGSFVGTPEYMSPEQAQGEKVDGRSDIYSLGVVFYEALAGEVPFESDTPWGVLNMHINKEPFPLNNLRKDIPKELVDVIVRMMAKDVDERFQTPKELIATLEAVLESIKLPKGTMVKKKKIPRKNPKRAKKVKRTFLIIFIILLLGGGGYFAYDRFIEPKLPKPANVLFKAEPIGAKVELKGPNDSEFIEVGLSEPDFTLEKYAPGSYEIRISHEGYVTQTIPFAIESGIDTNLDNILLKKPGKLETAVSEVDWGTVEEIPLPKNIEIKNSGESTLVVKRSKSGDWFTVEESDLSISPGKSISFPISINSTNLEPGVYSGTLTLTPENSDAISINIKLELVEPKVEIPVTTPPTNSGGGSSSGSGGSTTKPETKKTTGTLRFTCNVTGVAYKIDGNPAGTTSNANTVLNLSPGTHEIEIRDRKYETYKGTFTIVAGKTVTLNIKLELK
ncbi:MAG: protein kinase [Caldisericia bacterium]